MNYGKFIAYSLLAKLVIGKIIGPSLGWDTSFMVSPNIEIDVLLISAIASEGFSMIISNYTQIDHISDLALCIVSEFKDLQNYMTNQEIPTIDKYDEIISSYLSIKGALKMISAMAYKQCGGSLILGHYTGVLYKHICKKSVVCIHPYIEHYTKPIDIYEYL